MRPLKLRLSLYKIMSIIIYILYSYPYTGIYFILSGGTKLRYKTRGVCSREIDFDVEDNKIKNVTFVGGCNGNTQGVSRLIEGMDIDEAISRISGIDCGGRGTSCPDQLARALKEYKASVASGN